MAAPRSMTAQTLNALKGWPSPHAVDFEAKLTSSVTKRVEQGSCVHVDSNGNYALGVGTSAVFPLFLFNASDDPDVENEAPDASTEKGAYVPITPTGVMMALPAKGAYELVSTAFVDGNYPPNTHLTSDSGTDPDSNHGKLKAGTVYTDTIVGVVSRGKVDNGYGHTGIAFWPWYIPPTP